MFYCKTKRKFSYTTVFVIIIIGMCFLQIRVKASFTIKNSLQKVSIGSMYVVYGVLKVIKMWNFQNKKNYYHEN